MTLSQRRLVLELKVAIDRAMRTDRQQDVDYAIRLATDHVEALKRKYVRHNIGARRLWWLGTHIAEVQS